MFRLDLVILRPMLTIVLPDTVHTLGSHRVYIRRIHLVKKFLILLTTHVVLCFLPFLYPGTQHIQFTYRRTAIFTHYLIGMEASRCACNLM